MGRPHRYIAANTTYHVQSRCINREPFLENDSFKDLVLKALRETEEMYDFELNSFEILSNHVHFIITTKNNCDTISKIMQRLKSVIARRYNKLVKRTGPFWNERFGSQTITAFIERCAELAFSFFSEGFEKKKNTKYSSSHCYLKGELRSDINITFHKQYLSLGTSNHIRMKQFLNFLKISPFSSLHQFV